MKHYIYSIKSFVTGALLYVGLTENLPARIKVHRETLEKGTHVNPLIQSHAIFFGIEDMYFDVLHELSNDRFYAKDVENWCIARLNPAYNRTKKPVYYEITGNILLDKKSISNSYYTKIDIETRKELLKIREIKSNLSVL